MPEKLNGYNQAQRAIQQVRHIIQKMKMKMFSAICTETLRLIL